MILGVGVDIVEVERIRRALERVDTGARFKERVFTQGEIEYCERRRNRFESFAVRFAAKEAVIKALGRASSWREMEVVRGDAAPEIRLSGRTLEHADACGVRRLHLSLSHTAVHAIAYVIAEA